ncbi:3'-5' exonuclease [Kangiella aquimarina]|uniref:3'-5' exonuclease n=1 Tax=Kangiella aquimarina TaxID=261965 RepID=A0ABZ0X2R6_9GAMM|nr:3'-5' exonuclease [Kangiella aquimarina]WQG84877.1 3'-5' exonuclease [Kangiella aquimarina]
MNIFVFDIETIPDIETGRLLNEFEGLSDEDVVTAMEHLRYQQTGTTFQPLYLQKVVAISAVFRHGDKLTVWSLGDEQADEKEIIQRFFDGIDRFTPTIVSWNGSGFDLPVLHYRAIKHNIAAPKYWDTGEMDSQFKWNNYISRYHSRHLDLMDVIASYNPRANAPLDKIASMLGYPGKMGMSGAKVWETYHQGNLKAIRDYCETDVLNTYLVYLRFEVMRGNISQQDLEVEEQKLRDYLKSENQPHFNEFLEAWS